MCYSGRDCQGCGEVCQSCSITNIADKGNLEVSNNSLPNSICVIIINTIINPWWSNPTDDSSTKYCAGVGHHLPRASSLSPIQSGGEGDGGCPCKNWSAFSWLPYLHIAALFNYSWRYIWRKLVECLRGTYDQISCWDKFFSLSVLPLIWEGRTVAYMRDYWSGFLCTLIKCKRA